MTIVGFISSKYVTKARWDKKMKVNDKRYVRRNDGFSGNFVCNIRNVI